MMPSNFLRGGKQVFWRLKTILVPKIYVFLGNGLPVNFVRHYFEFVTEIT
jgi:hypothetical protein